jgi:hypothetical protein
MVLQSRQDALEDFRRARRKAQVGAVLARLRGKPYALLPFDEVRKKLGAISYGRRELRTIPRCHRGQREPLFRFHARFFAPRGRRPRPLGGG